MRFAVLPSNVACPDCGMLMVFEPTLVKPDAAIMSCLTLNCKLKGKRFLLPLLKVSAYEVPKEPRK